MRLARFSSREQFRWGGHDFEVRRLLANDMINAENLSTGEMVTVSRVQLLRDLSEGKMEFLVAGKSVAQASKSGYLDLADCPESLRKIAEWRFEMIRPFLDMPSRNRKSAIEQHVANVNGERREGSPSMQNALSVTSIYRWIREYETSGRDLRALIPATEQRGGKGRSRLHPDVEFILRSVLEDHFYVRERRTIDYFLREVAVRIHEANQLRLPDDQLVIPCRDTVARRIQALDSEKRLIAKRGSRAAKQVLTQFGKTEYPERPLERVEIDHTLTDIIIVDEQDLLPLGRLTLTYALDIATRYPYGYYLSFEPPSYYTVMHCLHHGIWPKFDVQERFNTTHEWPAYGIPQALVVDNGKEFIGRDLDDACSLLGINIVRTPVRTPRFKAAVERMFGTLNTGFLHGLPGTTFSNISRREGYNSLKQACITLSDLEKMMHIFLLDIYAEDKHRGLDGIPARKWEESVRSGFSPRLPRSAEELRILLGRVAYRTIQPYGVELFSLRYNCDDLVVLRTRMSNRENRKVKVKYDPADLGCIHIYDSEENRYIEVPALAQAYASGLSLWKHKVIRNLARHENDTVNLAALGEAQRRIQEIVDNSLRKKRLGTRSGVGRWQNGDKPILSRPDGGNALESPVEDSNDVRDFDLNLDPVGLEEEGWGVSYDLPRFQQER